MSIDLYIQWLAAFSANAMHKLSLEYAKESFRKLQASLS